MPSAIASHRSPGPAVWAAIAAIAGYVQASDPTPGRAGGLLPGEMRRAGLTRDELVREWDLDGDGAISKSEADVARGRMRKRRIEMQLQSGIDPLTGSPLRVDAGLDESAAEPGMEPEFRLPPELPPAPRAKDRGDSLPGLRPPAPPQAGVVSRSTPAASGERAIPLVGPAKPGPAPVSSRASWLPPRPFAPAVTGGVRAGAPAAVPGYGTGPWADLNAGRRPRRESGAGAETGAGQSTAGGGGLVPSSRPPGRTGAIILPRVPGRTGSPPAPNARSTTTPLVPRPQITAEDIGGYRP